MKVLVTGATGFLGSHVVRALLARGLDVRVLARRGHPQDALAGIDVEIVEGDLTEEHSLHAACRGAGGLVHCAARTGYWSRQNAIQRAINVEGTSALLRAAHKASIGRIVHVSSAGTVGCSRDGTVLDEAHVWNPRSLGIGYVTTKHEAEQRAFAAAWAGMDVVVVNPAWLVGPRFDGRPRSATITRIASRKTRWVPPGGTNVADVADVAEGCALAFERGRKGERYILGGHNLSWIELYAHVARVLGVPAPRRRVPIAAARALELGARVLDKAHLSRPPWTPEILRTWGLYGFVDSSKAERELGYRRRPLEALLARATALA